MKRNFVLLLTAFLLASPVFAQLLSWTPLLSKDNDNLSVIVDATKGNGGLNNYSNLTDVYVHTGVITNLSTSNTDWKYVKFGAQNPWGQLVAGLQAVSLGNNKWKYDINNVRAFYGVPAGETILKIAILFRNGNGNLKQTNTDGSDMFIPIYSTGLNIRFTEPPFQPTAIPIPEPINKQVGQTITVTSTASTAVSSYQLWYNGTTIQTANNVSSITATPSIAAPGDQTIVAIASDGTTTKRDTLRFFVSGGVNVAPLPAGVRDGINYEAGNTSAVLVLYAPGKNRVSVIGDLPGSNWQEQSAYTMSRTPDGNYWWLRITGLTPGTEYAFQYLVDGTLRVGDPYAEKVLDPWNDPFISASTFPNLKPYPTGQTSGIVSILQTNSPAYNWTAPNFNRPDKRGLILYELLLRDFIAAHDWKTLRDTLSYLQRLGVNAIKLMPVQEFDGNESWGYNPAYMFAPDKYYGPKNTLKEFIDTCHRRGIAVILDMVLNHTTGNNPLAALYWNSAASRPAANNPWLNETARHPFNVFNDFNHESLATRYFSSRVMEHWLKEYKVDGYRFDLSKGFTQNNTGTDVAAWGRYDASRVAIWKRYYDTLQVKSSGCYAILEHFADNSEEIELANYGMMLWGNNTYNFQEAVMGFLGNSNFSNNIFTARGWTNPHLVGYMESHDEERLMYKALQNGNSSGSYNVRDLNTALKRMELAAAFGMMIPGPRMIWQFGELGYDYSINHCPDGTVNNNCRTSNKPIRWDYQNVPARKALFNVYSKLNQLRHHPLYKNNFYSNRIVHSLNGPFKWMQLTTDTSNIVVLGNFDVAASQATITFPNSGTWYDHITGTTFTATGAGQSILLQPGEYKVYINRNLTSGGGTGGGVDPVNSFVAKILPNLINKTVSGAASAELFVQLPTGGAVRADLFNSAGQRISNLHNGTLNAGTHRISVDSKISGLAPGLYVVSLTAPGGKSSMKLVIQ
jgi:glycosidase